MIPHYPDWELRRQEELKTLDRWEQWWKAETAVRRQQAEQLAAGTLPRFRIEKTVFGSSRGPVYHLVWESDFVATFQPERDRLVKQLVSMQKRAEDFLVKAQGKPGDVAWRNRLEGARAALAYLDQLSDAEFMGLTLQAARGDAALRIPTFRLAVAGLPVSQPKGLRITHVQNASEEEKGGVKTGDVLLAVERRPVDSMKGLEEVLLSYAHGAILKWTLARGTQGVMKMVKVVKPAWGGIVSSEGSRQIAHWHEGFDQQADAARMRYQAYRARLMGGSLDEFIATARPRLVRTEERRFKGLGVTDCEILLWCSPAKDSPFQSGGGLTGMGGGAPRENLGEIFETYAIAVPATVTTVEDLAAWVEREFLQVERRWNAARDFEAKRINEEAFRVLMQGWDYYYSKKLQLTLDVLREVSEPTLKILRELHTALVTDPEHYRRELADMRQQKSVDR